MVLVPDVCVTCGAGGSCSDCLGAGTARMDPAETCISCGGTGEEPPLLESCSEELCGVSLPDAGRPTHQHEEE